MLFMSNKYSKWYFSIVENAKSQVRVKSTNYYESHHIIPKCMGGKELVLLTAKEHYICHLLLCKMTEGMARRKMLFALKCMSEMNTEKQKTVRYTSKTYEYFRPLVAKAISENNKGHSWNKGIKKTEAHRKTLKAAFAKSEKHKNSCLNNLTKMTKAGKWHKGRTGVYSEQTLEKMRRPKTEQAKMNMSLAKKGKPGLPKSEETKRKIAESNRITWIERRKRKATAA